MLVTAITLAALAFPGPELTKDQRETLSAVQKAYEANRSALGARGMIRFQGWCGALPAAKNIDDVDRAITLDWHDPKGSHGPSKGYYVFDAPYRRFETLYTPEQLAAGRTLIDEDHWTSLLYAARLLTDGETTLISNFDVHPRDGKVFHNGNLRAGATAFFRSGHTIPLNLGNPDPPWHDLGRCLRELLTDGGKSTLVELDENAELDGRKVMKIVVKAPDSPYKQSVAFWVDLQHGAMPLKSYLKSYAPHADLHSLVQWNNYEPRQVSKGWIPTRWYVTSGNIDEDGRNAKLRVQECRLEEANFDEKPDPSVFALDYPEEMILSDSDRDLAFGSRTVWHVKDFSPAARAKARPLGTPPVTIAEMPEMPDARDPWSLAAIFMMVAGLALLAVAGIGAYKRYHRIA